MAQSESVRQMQIDQFKALGRSYVNQTAPVMVGMVQTAFRRIPKLMESPPDLIIVDECHLSISNTYKTIIDAFKASRVVGLTATPVRLSGEGMGAIYDDMVVLCQPQELLDMGFLVPVRAFGSPIQPDLSSVKTRMGDFSQGELSEAMDKSVLIGNAVEHYIKHANGKRAIAFCVSVAHADHVASEFRIAGLRAVSVNGDTEGSERSDAIKKLASGELDVVANCGLYIEGLDCPSIECVIDLAPTQSLTRFLQKIGRGLRTSPATGKESLICLDHANNFSRHGHPYDDREWSLEGRKKKPKNSEPDVTVQTCQKCFAMYRPQPACPVCGHQAEQKQRKGPEEVEGDLVEIDKDARKNEAKATQARAQTVEDLMRIPGMSRGRAVKIVAARDEKETLRERARELVRMRGGPSPADLRQMKPKQLRVLLGDI